MYLPSGRIAVKFPSSTRTEPGEGGGGGFCEFRYVLHPKKKMWSHFPRTHLIFLGTNLFLNLHSLFLVYNSMIVTDS